MMDDDILTLFEIGGCEVKIEVTAYGDGITVSVDEPWAGSTETGFGQTTSVRLTKEQGQELGRWLTKKCVA